MAARKRNPWGWLLAAVVLLLAGAWLMFSTDPAIPEGRAHTLPKRMRSEELRRAETRRTLVEQPPLNDAGEREAVAPLVRDPVLALMPAQVKRAAVVAEFNAIVNSDLGGLMMQCLFEGDDQLLGQLRDAGLDPATSIDRVAFIDDALVVTGNFKDDAVRMLLEPKPLTREYGRRGRLYEWPQEDGGRGVLGSWGEQLVITGDRRAVEGALDRLETSGPRVPGVLTEDDAYGEVYGVVDPSVVARLIGREDEGLARTMREAASSVTLHVDLQHDVGLVADVTGQETGKTEELRRALGGALSVARVQAQAQGRSDQVELFDLATVQAASDGKFRLTAGVPYEMMKKAFLQCVDRKAARRAGDAGQLD